MWVKSDVVNINCDGVKDWQWEGLCSSDASLKCLYSGLTASDVDNINCDGVKIDNENVYVHPMLL